MTHRRIFVKMILTVTMLLAPLVAADARGVEAPPAPSPEVKKTVDAFEGRRTLEGTIVMPGEGPKAATMKMDCRKTAKGKAVACTFSGPFDGSALVAYDPYSKAVHFMAVTSDDEVHDHACQWQADQKLVCAPLKAGMSGMAITEDLEFFGAGKTLGFKAVMTMPDGRKATCEFKSRG
jgi:hypothetical protein